MTLCESRRGRRAGRAAGFTLVELLVVIAVISILAGLLLPALAKARAAAESVARTSIQKQLYLALDEYIDDWNGALPTEGKDHPYGGASQSFQCRHRSNIFSDGH